MRTEGVKELNDEGRRMSPAPRTALSKYRSQIGETVPDTEIASKLLAKLVEKKWEIFERYRWHLRYQKTTTRMEPVA